MPSKTPQLPSFDDLAAAYAAHMDRQPVSPSTVRAYRYGAEAFIAWLAAQDKHRYEDLVEDDIAATHAVRDFKRHQLTVAKLKPKSVDLQLSGVTSLFSFLGRERPDVRLSVSKRTSFVGEPDSLDEDQVRDVLRAAERRGTRDFAIVLLMYASGARIGEVAALDVDDVPLSERKGMVHIRAGKGDKPRDINLEFHRAVDALNRWVRLRRSEYGMDPHSGPLFVTGRGERLALRSIRHIISRVGEASGVEGLHPHQLRHTCARTLIDKGYDAPTVAAIMGHSSLETTMIYTRPRASHREAAAAALAIDF